ncbi:DoxX family protein [Gordonia sp. HY002]|uniref:DoxX family protein n=1 Tax=Gordonia zhenghanii TaxID=2911516 RepID=UPI001EEFDE81|nr:DoxX family protein [Gordonia zhenghanii]MCF8569967.1 DoxX family protein [Gordonia zhenghanii]MCF8604348.1 DoxX family protein [Gordonia zhenghanii]
MNPLKHAQGLSTTIARVILGIIFLAHGCQKLFVNGMDATSAGFDMMGAPLPTLSAWVAAILEFAGGIALIAGIAVPLVALLLIFDMIGAIFIAHIDAGFWSSDGGYELPLALIAGLIAIAIADQGVASVDSHVAKRFKK